MSFDMVFRETIGIELSGMEFRMEERERKYDWQDHSFHLEPFLV